MTPGSGITLKHLLALSCFVISITNLTACSQVHGASDSTLPETPAKSAAPVAYVYVSQKPAAGGPNEVLGYSVAPSGNLTPIKGSPFDVDVYSMVVNGKYMFAENTSGVSFDTYTIEPNGALRFVVSNPVPASLYDQLFLDHTGSVVYTELEYGDGGYGLSSLAVNKATGTLSLTPGSEWDELGAKWSDRYTVSADNKFIFVAGTNIAGDGAVTTIRRESDGTTSVPWTTNRWIGNAFLISADPLNHVAVALEDVKGTQLAVYTSDAEGNLTTTSTTKNMPTLIGFDVFGPTDLKMSPSGKILAVSGPEGLQVFHFNGANPITSYTTLVKNPKFNPSTDAAPFKQLGWDNENHLFALFANKLYVFTVTPSSVSKAPGSPYSISGFPGAQYITVQPLPLP